MKLLNKLKGFIVLYNNNNNNVFKSNIFTPKSTQSIFVTVIVITVLR